MNAPRADHAVRIPLHGGPDAVMQYVYHHPHPRTGLPKPDSAWTHHPNLGMYVLHGDTATTWQYIWTDRDAWLRTLK